MSRKNLKRTASRDPEVKCDQFRCRLIRWGELIKATHRLADLIRKASDDEIIEPEEAAKAVEFVLEARDELTASTDLIFEE